MCSICSWAAFKHATKIPREERKKLLAEEGKKSEILGSPPSGPCFAHHGGREGVGRIGPSRKLFNETVFGLSLKKAPLHTERVLRSAILAASSHSSQRVRTMPPRFHMHVLPWCKLILERRHNSSRDKSCTSTERSGRVQIIQESEKSFSDFQPPSHNNQCRVLS